MLALDLQPISAFPLRVVAMQRLLANLIDNVLYHGGGDAEVRTRLFDGRVLLSVLDRGPGLPTPHDGNTAPSYRARLGLVVVERIVQLHEGSRTKISLRRRPGSADRLAIYYEIKWQWINLLTAIAGNFSDAN